MACFCFALFLLFIFPFWKLLISFFIHDILKFHNNLPWCGSFCHLQCRACDRFRQGNSWSQFWEFYFCIISLNIASAVFSPFFPFWNSYYLHAKYPRWTLQFSYFSFQFSICLSFRFTFWEVSSCSKCVSKNFFWSVHLNFQELCSLLSLTLHFFFWHCFRFLHAASPHVSDKVTYNFWSPFIFKIGQ